MYIISKLRFPRLLIIFGPAISVLATKTPFSKTCTKMLPSNNEHKHNKYTKHTNAHKRVLLHC